MLIESLNLAEHKLPYDYITSNFKRLSSFLLFLSSILNNNNIEIMKFIVHLTLLLVFVSASKERSNNQEALEGVWEYFK